MVALAELIPYAIALVCLALAAIITVIVVALFKWLIDILNTIPLVNIGTGWLNTTEQTVTHALGVAFGWVNKEVGASFHQLARFTDWLWDELRGHGILLLEIASGIYPIVVAVHALKNLVHHLTATSKTGDARVKTLEREYRGIEAKIKTLEHDYSHGIGHDVLPRIKTLEREAARVEKDIAIPLRDGANTASAAIDNLYEWAKGKASLLGVGTFSLAVSTALAALGLDWLSCKNVGRLGRSLCGLPLGLLDDLLALAIVPLIAADVCDFADSVETIALDFQGALFALVDAEDALVGCHGATAPPALSLPTLHFPPTNLGLVLAG